MPDHSNDLTKATENKLGPFIFDLDEEVNPAILDKGPFELDNGAIYHGQWTIDGKR